MNKFLFSKGDKMKKRTINFIKEIYNIIKKPVMGILPGQLAFSFVLTIIPILAIVGWIGAKFSLSVENLSEFVRENFPATTSNLLLPLIDGVGFDVNILVFLISAFVLASRGAYSIIVTSNILYNIELKGAFRRRVKSVIITLILILLICFLIIVPGFGDQILSFIVDLSFVDPISEGFIIMYHILKYPISFLLIFFNIKLIYTIAPDKFIKSKTVNIGTMLTTVLWILLTRLYSYYVSNFVNYDIFYGSLSNIIILLLWMYLLSYIFVLGLALNAGKIE